MVRFVAVIDIGKTNAKLLLIDLSNGQEIRTFKTPNRVINTAPYPHFDAERLWSFLTDSLTTLAAEHAIDAISITTHGACAVLVDAQGDLTLPILDYEFAGPDTLPAYNRLRPDFAETGSPRLPGGLNLGAQIYWQAQTFPEAFARTAHILTYPQYWAFRLSGVALSEVTSLGCHTDLWNPWTGTFSALIAEMGWRDLFPPIRPASARLTLKPQLARQLGLNPATPVHSGIHDSNASLLPYLGEKEAFSVISSGTWMITMGIGGTPIALDPARDTLVNVNANGTPTPTARYMGGREFDELTQSRIAPPTEGDRAAVLGGIMALPSLHPDTGPFPGLHLSWTTEPVTDGQRNLAASYYTALMGAECLALIGAQGPIHVEGPFGGNPDFALMLATATGRPVLAAGQTAGTGPGAALLAGPLTAVKAEATPVQPSPDPRLEDYAAAWKDRVAALWAARQA
ncbi:MAG: FGGY-family carbohydrate kinase [Cypionkella sp.]